MIDNAGYGIYAANEIFYRLYSSNKELNDVIVDARNKMPGLVSDIKREKNFVDKYLKKWGPLRVFVFFQWY